VNRLRTLLLVALVVLTATGAEAATIVILRPQSSSAGVAEALHRLQGELLALGIEVPVVERPAAGDAAESDARARLEQLANEQHVDALMDVIGETTPAAVDIWIFESAARRSRVSRVVPEPNAPNAAETLAIRAIEVLRSAFVEIDLAARRHPEANVAPPPRDEPPKPPPRRSEQFGLEAGAAVLTSFDGVGPAFLPMLRFDWAASSWLVAQATVAGFGTRPAVETDVGTARVSQGYGVLGVCLCAPSARGLRPLASLSLGALRTSLDGEAEFPEEGHVVDQWSFLVDASLGGQLRFSERLYLTLAAHVQLAQPYVAVHFVDERVATSGHPNAVLSLTLGAWL
jgi:hypothetical protein